jgi:molecular chaperone GrpE
MDDDDKIIGLDGEIENDDEDYDDEPIGKRDEPVETDADLIIRLEAEKSDLTERYIRLAAEMDNLRKRSQRDVRDAKTYAVSAFAGDMLSVADNLARALEAIPQEARESGDAGFKALIEGVEMTGRAMLSGLERHGVKKLEPEGERFDPNLHQAMFEVPNPDVPANTVVQVMQAGYIIGDRCLRPAMVGVAKGGPKPGARPEAVEPGPVTEETAKDA